MGTQYDAENERQKRNYTRWLTEAQGRASGTAQRVVASMTMFEEHTGFKPFRSLHVEQIISFKEAMAKPKGDREPVSISRRSAILADCRALFAWLSEQPGFRSAFRKTDFAYFSLPNNYERIAKAANPKVVPTADEIEKALEAAPSETILQRRDRALFAFLWLTGARDAATASFRIRHVDLEGRCLYQRGADSPTKWRKTFPTTFFPVKGRAEAIVTEWITELTGELGFGRDDPLFPATKTSEKGSRKFGALGLSPRAWSNSNPIRVAVRRIFTSAQLPYFSPHKFRDALGNLGLAKCKTIEEFKAWSQNLGHENLGTTLSIYAKVPEDRQAALISLIDQAPDELASITFDQAIEVLRRHGGQIG